MSIFACKSRGKGELAYEQQHEFLEKINGILASNVASHNDDGR